MLFGLILQVGACLPRSFDEHKTLCELRRVSLGKCEVCKMSTAGAFALRRVLEAK